MITIDGSYLEGGGQIVRTALGLSTLLNKPFRAMNIRQGRKDAGLKAQHVHAIKALQELCHAEVTGVVQGSTELTFVPGKLKPKKLDVDIGTAGSISLFLQALLIPLVFAAKKTVLTIRGGTDVEWSSPVDYMAHVMLPYLEQYAGIDFRVMKRGYYPKGGGMCMMSIKPKYPHVFPSSDGMQELKKQIPPLQLEERGELVQIRGICNASASLMEKCVAERVVASAKTELAKKYAVPIEMRTEYAQTASPGCSVSLYAMCSTNPEDITPLNRRYIGADVLGRKEISSEEMGRMAAQKLIATLASGAAVDEYMADQLVPYLGLMGGVMKTPSISLHAKTNMFVVEQFLGKRFEVHNATIRTQK